MYPACLLLTYLQSLIYCGIKLLVDTVIDIPFSLYSDFVLEERHGFNKKTIGLFFKDLFISLALQAVIGAPVLCIVIFLVNWGGDLFYLYVGLHLNALYVSSGIRLYRGVLLHHARHISRSYRASV